MSNPYQFCNPIPNFDKETGIHYGVIAQNDVMSEALSDIFDNGTDVGYENAVQQVKDELSAAILGALEPYVRVDGEFISDDVDNIWDAVKDRYGYDFGGESGPYRYESDGYIIETDSHGDMFIIKSPYYTLRGMCSPCAPNAGHLQSDGSLKTYALGFDWFDKDSPAPYDVIYGVGTGLEIKRPKEQNAA